MTTPENDAGQAVRSTRLLSALKSILERVMDHPCFDADKFEQRDIDGLCDEGGETCHNTIIAIECADAILSNNRSSVSGPASGTE